MTLASTDGRTLLVDGHSLLFRMFCGMPSRIVPPKGTPIHAVIGFMGALRREIEMLRPDYTAVFFDKEVPLPFALEQMACPRNIDKTSTIIEK